MNERIRELAEQADNYAEQTVHYYNGQFEGLTWEGKLKQVRDKKFAELIVQECAELVRKYNYECIRNDVPYGISSDDIMKHFGDEE